MPPVPEMMREVRVMGTAGPGGTGQRGGRPAEDAGEQARRLRAVPVDQVLGDLLLRMLTAAQVKLGRRDARLLIDVAAVAHEEARPHLPGEFTRQIDQLLGQLRMGQVSAEGRTPRHRVPRRVTAGHQRMALPAVLRGAAFALKGYSLVYLLRPPAGVAVC
jgi:hypothetical protein